MVNVDYYCIVSNYGSYWNGSLSMSRNDASSMKCLLMSVRHALISLVNVFPNVSYLIIFMC